MGNGATITPIRDSVKQVLMSKMSVTDYLNQVSYPVNPNYTPSDFALGFVNFIKLVNGEEGEEHETPIVHYRMLDTLTKGGKRIANLCHRGIAKTTLMGEYLILYLALYGEMPGVGKVNLAIYVSDSIDNGVKNMRKNLEHRWEESAFLQKFIPVIRFTDIRWEFVNAAGKKFVVKGYGAKTGVRGTKELGVRPQLAILDDLLSDEDARSATVIASILSTIRKALRYAVHPTNSLVIWSGTPFNARDPLYMAVESGVWHVNVFPVCERFPCDERDFRSSWPDRFTYEYVKDNYETSVAEGDVASFDQEMMLRIMSDDDRLITDSDIMWYTSTTVTEHKEQFNFYITTDYATGEKESSDFSVTSVWATNYKGYWFWVDGVCKRQTMDKNIDDLFRLTQKYQPQTVGVEVSGQQAGFVSWIQKEMEQRKSYFNLASEGNEGRAGIRPVTNKMVRFNLMVPNFKLHRMFFPEDKKYEPAMVEAMEELTLASPGGFKSKHDDFIDTISMLASLTVWLPSEGTPMKVSDDGVWGNYEEAPDYNNLSSYVV